MAELDYAVLAEYARLDAAGLMTIVGGSFDHVQAAAGGGVQQVYVALRIRIADEEDGVPFKVKFIAPEHSFEAEMSGVTSRRPGTTSVGGLYSFSAAVGVAVPLQVAGTYQVQIFIDDRIVHGIPFVVSIADQIY